MKSKNNFRTGYFAFRKKIEGKSAKKLFLFHEKILERREKFLVFLVQ